MDVQPRMEEIEAKARVSSWTPPASYDGGTSEFPLDGVFDDECVRWYRAVYEATPGNRSYRDLANADF